MRLHADGFSLFRNLSHQLWPIFEHTTKAKSGVFVVGLISGNSKSKRVSSHLNDIICRPGEVASAWFRLCHNGQLLNVALHNVIADVPVRSFINQMKLHSGYASCFRCTQTDPSQKHRLIFPTDSGRLRMDDDFRSRQQEEHPIGFFCLKNRILI